MTRLACPNCKVPLAPADVDISLGIASCEACGQVHDLRARAVGAVARTAPDPTGIETSETAVAYPWRGLILLFLVAWCAIWDGGMVMLVVGSLAAGDPTPIVFASVHMLVGVGVTYFTLAMALNRTEVRFAAGELVVSHGPLPWPGGRTLTGSEIEQVYVMEDRGSKGGRTYSLHARVRPGHAVKLLGGLATAGRARFIEDWIERKLGVVDVPVSGAHH